MSLARKLDAPWLEGVMRQFEHVPWEGFRVWDLIMPLFMFMAGASMPFSFAKFGDDKRAAYLRIARRVVLLFIFGMVVQGNLLGLDPHRIYLYSNTLQAIAAGYLIASVAMLHCKLRGQIAVAVLLLVAYWVPMTLLGDFTPDGNFAEAVDRAVLGRFRRRILGRRGVAFLGLLSLYVDPEQPDIRRDGASGQLRWAYRARGARRRRPYGETFDRDRCGVGRHRSFMEPPDADHQDDMELQHDPLRWWNMLYSDGRILLLDRL